MEQRKMKRVTLFDIQSYFQRYGWSYERDGQTYSYTTSSDKIYYVRASVSSTFVSFESSLTSIAGYNSSYTIQREVSDLLMKLNFESSLVKISANKSGDIFLIVDSLNIGFSYSQFEIIIGIIGHYSDLVADKVSCLLDEIKAKRNHIHSFFYSQR